MAHGASFTKEKAMSDGKTKRGAADRTRINLNQDYERSDWAKSLGVSEEELTAAVHAVGNSAEKVREYLKERHHPSRA